MDGEPPLRVADLASSLRDQHPLDGLIACYPDRWGGVSKPPFDTLNLGFSTGDDPLAVIENRCRLLAAVGLTLDDLVVAGQTHGCQVVTVTQRMRGEGARAPSTRLAGNDVVILEDTGVFALALSADCPLVAVADPTSKRVGVAHCGWRGTAAGALDRLLQEFDPGSAAVAMLSPAICGEVYRVGPEVHEALRGLPGAEQARCGEGIDLRTILEQQLIQGGFAASRIAFDRRCTASETGLFSFRRDAGSTGRSGLLLGWKS